MRRGILFAALGIFLPVNAHAQTWHGASQFNDDHAFTKALVRFQELVDKYSGKKTSWVLHKNSELGLEKQYFEYMAQGKAVDYAIVSPAHMSTFSRAAPFIDAPFISATSVTGTRCSTPTCSSRSPTRSPKRPT